MIHQRTILIQRTLARATATRGPSRALPLTNRYSLYSTYSFNSSSSSSPSSSAPSSVDARKAGSQQTGGRLTGWIRRISLMSASAAAGAFVYSKVDPVTVGGFSGMPIGKIQPSILTVEEPDQEFPSNIKDSPEKLDEIRRSVVLEKELQDLDLVIEYKNKVKEGEWKQADPYWYLTKVTQPHHLLAGALRGENMLSVHPLKFERKDKKAIVLFLHLGRSLCGHDQIIHGGLLGTLLDEATGMVALPNLPFHVAFTANLNINYRKPVKADQFVMITAEFEKAEGRKGYTKATIHDLHGNTLVECTALYISPKNPVAMVANYVKNSLGI